MKRILVIETRQIGDVFLTSPLIHAARERWPSAMIDVVGFSGTLGMLRGNPDVNSLVEFPHRLGWTGILSVVSRLWRHYDLALITQASDRAHLMGWIAAPYRSGILPEHGSSNWWKQLLLTHVVRSAGDRGAVHVAVEKLQLLSPWTKDEPVIPQTVLPRAHELPADVLENLHPGAVIVHAPSMWPYKQWPLDHFHTLVRELLVRQRQVILTGGPGTRDRECVASLLDLAAPPQLLNLVGRLDFNQLTTLLGKAALYIGPDTSLTHLAAATGLPVIAIFGPTNPLRWGPWPNQAKTIQLFQRAALVQTESNVTVLQAKLPCVPCGRAGCEDHLQSRSDCLAAITPQQVLEQALRLLTGFDSTKTQPGS